MVQGLHLLLISWTSFPSLSVSVSDFLFLPARPPPPAPRYLHSLSVSFPLCCAVLCREWASCFMLL